jgi:hypothetical protein
MDEPQSSEVNPSNATLETSLGSRMMNVYIAPSEVFDEVKASPPNIANWLVPLVIVIITGIIYTMIVFGQPGVVQGVKDMYAQTFQKQVAAGKMPQAQADAILDKIEPWITPTACRVFGLLMIFITQPVMLAFVSLIFWVVGRFCLGERGLNYPKSLEAVGLVTMISVPVTIITIPIAVIYGNMFMNPGPVLFISHFNAANRVHTLLSALGLHTLWPLAVLSIALSRMSGASYLKSALWCFTPIVLLLGARFLLT